MSRLFDGVDDEMVYGSMPALGNGPNISFGTFLIVARILHANDDWMSFFELETSGGVINYSWGRHSNNSIYLFSGNTGSTAESDPQDITSADNWAVYAVTKATGSVVPTMIKCPIGGSVASQAGSIAQANPASTSTVLRLGGNDDPANMRVAAAACFQGVVLTTGNITTIATTKTTQQIIDLGATWCVDDSDSFATDLVGSVDRTAITGTADDADDPAGWSYFGGSGPVTKAGAGIIGP